MSHRIQQIVFSAVLALVAGAQAASYDKEIKPLLEKHCTSCHGEKKSKAGLTFDAFPTIASVKRDWRLWLHCGERVRSGEMPPDDKPPMSKEEKELFLNWLARDMFPVDLNKPDPGRVVIRRLNKVEYNNTVRDLLGVDFKPADDFPADDPAHGFDNIGAALTVSPMLMEKYITAAQDVVDRALSPQVVRIPVKRIRGRELKSRGEPANVVQEDRFAFFKDGVAGIEGPVEKSGQYKFRILAMGERAGTEPPKLVVKLDGADIAAIVVTNFGRGPRPYEFQKFVQEGRRKLDLAYVNNFRDPENRDERLRDRNAYVYGIEIEGPLEMAAPTQTDPRSKIIFVTPDAKRSTNDALRAVIGRFASRAYRRPVLQQEIGSLVAFAENTIKSGATFDQGVKAALTAVLVSPSFLYRGELPVAGADRSRGIETIDEFALASRLSYFLWSTMPDDELFGLASSGRLRANLDAQVRRMIKDPRSRELAENFAGQWLQTRNLEIMAPDAKMFPEFDDELRTAMRRETELFFSDILWSDRTIMNFLFSTHTFVNERLANFYGIKGVTGPEFRRVPTTGTPRTGIFAQAGVLTVTSNPTRTSPVKRGKWILDNILNQPPPPPPPNVPVFPEEDEGAVAASLRDRMVAHRKDPMCASCHIQMDAIGFSFEHFDAIGRWRATDGKHPIDDSCEMNNGDQFEGVSGLQRLLIEKRRAQFAKCFTEKLLTYALGRGIEYYDLPTIDRICANAALAEFKMSAYILEIVKSPPFQTRRIEGVALRTASN